ncbi:PQQ-dependent sugar dehydrogenase [Prosthecobacter sp.]|uniref:PQQ-dependent sugar dehydrogenase n=1 Tax=Prosthecobacter sp. TaxID=1965333 RepID=UPI0037843F5D
MTIQIRSLRSFLQSLCLLCATTVSAAFPTLGLKPVVLKQIHSPTTITSAGDGSGRLFVCDQPGKIYIVQGGMLLPVPFLDVTSLTVSQTTGYNERGLLGLAFHPGFASATSPGYQKFYILYSKNYIAGTDPGPPQAGDPVTSVTVVAEFQVSASNPNVADLASERRLLLFTRPQANHNGGQLEFGPDGYLYISSGDGGSQMDNNSGHTGGSGARPTNNLGNGQDKTRLLGKILRIDPIDPDGAGPLTYGIPSSNPFFNDSTVGIKKEIYSFGMRNPWRFSFDKRPGGTNRMFCGDVGGDRIEEIDIIVAGGNYGWRYKEGHEFPSFSSGAPTNPMPDPLQGPYISPIAEYAHPGVTTTAPVLPQLGMSVTGGYVYRGSAIPALQGRYVFGDYGATAGASDGRLMGLEETSPNSGIFTLTQALSILHSSASPNITANNNSNPIIGQRILCLGEDESGEIYIGMKTKPGVLELDGGSPSGGIYKIVPAASGSLTLTPTKDNTIFSENTSNASGQGGMMFAGVTNTGSPRRGLIAFDVSSVPAGATVSSAQVQLSVQLGQGSNNPMSLNLLTQSWGEGTSNAGDTGGTGVFGTAGDATWNARFFSLTASSTLWTTPGGDFIGTASATTPVSAAGTYTWTSAQLATDVQGWVSNPASNNGWILLGDEASTFNAKRVYSREATTASLRPQLSINYASLPPPSRFEVWLATYFPANATGQFVDPNGDADGDGNKNQIEYAYGLSPTSPDPVNNFSAAISPAAAGATDFTVTFRRDGAATDLTYRLQTSTDLSSWTTIAQSTTGAAPVGQNGGVIVSDSALGGTIKLVTARQTLPAGSNSRKFVRLQVDRQ